MPRWLITILLFLAAGFLTWAMVNSARQGAEPKPNVSETTPAAPPADPSGSPANAPQPTPAADAVDPLAPVEGLRVREVTETQPEPVIGKALDDESNPYGMEAKLTPWGGGILETRLARHSLNVATEEEDFTPYPVQRSLTRTNASGRQVTVYPMAAASVAVNGRRIVLENKRWEVVKEATDGDSAQFRITLEDGAGQSVLEIVRTWSLTPRPAGQKKHSDYSLRLDQSIRNLSGLALQVAFNQYGPGDLPSEQGYIGDQRHLVLGYLKPYRGSQASYITTEDFHLIRNEVLDPDAGSRLWPVDGEGEGHRLLWATLTNRYFAAAVYAAQGGDGPPTPLQGVFPTLERVAWGGAKPDDQSLVLELRSATMDLPAGSEKSLDLELYAGPKLHDILDHARPYASLGLDQMIVYNLGGCCAICTFAWLANGLLAFLSFIHGLVRDWGVAIIVLVAVVRTLLHPLTKSSQVNMMKLSKQMAALQPEMEKLRAKYKDDPTKLNQEIWNLQRERGMNPASMGLGCLPMFLQMPIWIALYAMLYFAIELRQEPAFWGFFQRISGGNWAFLADLSSQDHFIALPAGTHVTIPWVGWTIDSINLLPLLMGVVFYLQQKYMTAPNPNMSAEMRQQQAMMKWMTVIMMPLFLYKAPSGLTLYILTSTFVGIIESKRVRQHVKELEESGKLHEKKPPKPGGLMDRLGKLMEARKKLYEEQMRIRQQEEKKNKKKR